VLDDVQRWAMAPKLSPASVAKTFLYVTEDRHDRHALLASQFNNVALVGAVERTRQAVPIARYLAYRLIDPRSPATAFAAP
jgi:hypothetical protein